METKKGLNTRYNTLLVRELKSVQTASLKKEFELAESSRVAEAACDLTAMAIDEWEKDQDVKRLKPGELFLIENDQELILPLLDKEALTQLKDGTSYRAVKRELEYKGFEKLKEVQPEASMDDFWHIINQSELSLKRSKENFLPDEKLNSDTLLPFGGSQIKAEIPEKALEPAKKALVDEWGLRPALAEAMAQSAASIYAMCSPLTSEINSGQIVWLTHGTRKTRRTDPSLFQPVILTLLTEEDMKRPLSTTADLKRLKTVQLERITSEAWIQDGVLTTLDMEWLLGISPPMLRNILDAYFEEFGIILPTAGTVLDMGRTLTHKKIVIEMSLSGMNTQEIASRIYHTPIAVDNYLRLFDRVLLLKYYNFPVEVMPRVIGYSKSLLDEHLKLVEKHFPTEEALSEYLGKRNIKLYNKRTG